jgi:N-acyl-D-amino-acid deacylase
MVDPHVSIGTDGSAGGGHPRGYGSFARVIGEFVVDKRLLTLAEAVHKMSGLGAETLDLLAEGRGLVKEGFAADLLVFDPTKVRAVATFQRSTALAEGFDWVIVNGAIVRDGGTFTRARAGRILLHAPPGS